MKCITQSIQFWIGSKEKNAPPLGIICINNLFWDFSKETKYRFRSKIPDLDFSKETHHKHIVPFSLTSPSSLLELPNDLSAL